MSRGFCGATVLRVLTVIGLWSALGFGMVAPAPAQSSNGQFRTEINEMRLKMRGLWGEIERFRPKAFYCRPPQGPVKQPDEMLMQAYSARVDAVNKEYAALKQQVRDFLNGNHELLAQLEVNGLTPLDDRWWAAHEEDRQRMLREYNAKKTALQNAPVRDCSPKPKQPTQVADSFQAPELPQPPTYAEANFPTIPTHFCSEAEYWKFINEVMNPPYLESAKNAELAARFRGQVERAVNHYVQAGRPVPANLQALRRRAIQEVQERDRISQRFADARRRAGQVPIIDCSKKREPTQTGLSAPGGRFGKSNDLYARVWSAYSRFEDARERCDAAQMAATLKELEDIAREAERTYSDVADSMHGGPFDQADTPENRNYHEALADRNSARTALERARSARAKDCVPCTDPPAPPPVTQVRVPAASPDASRQAAAWLEGTNALFTQLGAATRAKDCARVRAIMEQIARRFRGMTPLQMSLVPAEIRLAWKVLFLQSLPLCRPADPDQPESILDEIDEVPVIAQVPTDRTSAALLAYHNQLRSQAGSSPLRWDPELAARATQYATVLASTGQLQHASRQGRERERENIVLGRRGDSAMTMVRTWGAEQARYRGGIFPTVCVGDWSTCAHYTQIIWSRTKRVGCGYVTGVRFNALVCRYGPPGNQDGQPVVRPPSRLATLTRRCPPSPRPLPPPPPPP